MIPTKFQPHTNTDRRYRMTYDGGEMEEIVIDVRLDGEVLSFGFPYSHGSSLQIGRIENESAEHITFTTVNPPVDFMEGVVTLRDTGEVHRWA